MKPTSRVVIVGGGLAGAASAWGLARRGHDVTLVEGEPRAGVHASGRNAGMIRRIVSDPSIGPLALEGARLLGDPPADLREAADEAPLIRPTGSVVVAGPEQATALREQAARAREAGVACEETPAAALGERLEGARCH